jgi:hypothetical protein
VDTKWQLVSGKALVETKWQLVSGKALVETKWQLVSGKALVETKWQLAPIWRRDYHRSAVPPISSSRLNEGINANLTAKYFTFQLGS